MANEPKPEPAPAAPAKPKKKRRALRIAGGILGVPLLLVTLGVGYLHTGSGKARVRGAIEDKLRERVNGTVDIGVCDYSLFGDVKLGDVHVKDTAGVEALGLSSLTVSPSWGDLVGGHLVIAGVTVTGVAVHIVKDADGSSNLSRLIKPVPEDPNKKPLDKRVEVKALSIGDVVVDILQPDGAKVCLSGVTVEGNLAIQPANRDVDVEISKIGLGLALDKGQGGLKVGLTGVETGMTVGLVHGVGKATLHPLKGHVAVTLPDRPEKGFDIGLAGFSADIGPEGLGVSLDQLLAGALALASVEVKGHLTDGKVDGKQDADVIGLKVSGTRVNEFLGKEMLLGDIEVETHVHGPPDKIQLSSKITTAGARMTLDGEVGVADAANPTYDMALAVYDVDTDKVLAPEMGVARATIEKVEASVKGSGRKAESAGAEAKIKITGVTARGVRIDGIELEGELDKGVFKVKSARVDALGQKVSATGEVELATKRIDLDIGIDGDVGDALGHLKAAGIPVKSSLPKGAVRLPAGDLHVHAKGLLAGAIDVQATAKKIGVLGGTLGIDARASLVRHDPPLEDGKKVTVTAMDADLHVGGVKLSSILAMRGKKLRGMDGTLSGDVHLEGSPESPRAKLLLGLVTSRADGGKTLRLSLSGEVSKQMADLKASLTPGADSTELFGLTAKLPLSLAGQKKGIDPHRPIEVHAALPKKTLEELWTFVPSEVTTGTIQKLPPGDVALALDVKGTAARPEAKLHATVTAKALPGMSLVQKVDVDATLSPTAGSDALVAKSDVNVWLDASKPQLVHLTGDVNLSRSPILGPPEIAYKAGLVVGPISPADLEVAPPDIRAMGGTVLALADLHGNKEDLAGTLTLTAEGVRPTGTAQMGVGLSATLGDADTDVNVKVRVADSADGAPNTDLLKLSGKVGLAGKKLFAQLKDKEHLDPSLALALDIPKRALASLGVLRPKLAGAPGNLSGQLAVSGSAKVPLVKGSVALDDVDRMDGKKGGLGLSIDAGKDQIAALVGVGLSDPGKAPLQIAVTAPREPIARMSDGASLPVSATIRAKAVDLRELVPAVLLAGTKVGVKGTLDWNMDVKAQLGKTKAGVEALEGSVAGLLDLHEAEVALPGTKRAYSDVGLLLKADDKGLHLDALRAKETDLERSDRTIAIKGDVTLDKLRPTAATLSLAANKWLLFGPRALGFADAPRGTLTLEAQAKVDLASLVKHASVDVKKLDLSVPDRFERAHQPEDVQAGDIVFLDDKKTGLGKLVVPNAAEKPAAPKAPVETDPKKETGFDVDIRVAEGAHVLQAPIELFPKGELHIKIRPSGRETRGALTMTAGTLSLGGQPHPLVSGSLTFDEKNPTGTLDLTFERPMKARALRDISEASAGQSVKIHMYGPIADRTTVLSGAGSPGALWDLLSMHTVGRQRYVSEPDLPASMSVDFPQHENLLVLSFLSVNLPHLLFLDRFAAWADPYDDPRAYGKLTHFEAERILAGDSVRVRTELRPPAAGQSDAEVEIDYLFVNVPRMLFGVGLTGGTRGGGGPGVVWEWSSKD